MTSIAIFCKGLDRHTIIRQPWRHIYEISKRMAEKGATVALVSNGARKQVEDEIDGIRVHRTSLLPLSFFSKRKDFEQTILSSRPDVIIWHDSPLGAINLLSLRRLEKPVIWSIDSDLFRIRTFSTISIREIFSPSHRLLWRQLLAAICPRFIIKSIANSGVVQRIVVPSLYLKSSLCKTGISKSKIEVVRPAIDNNFLPEKNEMIRIEDLEREKLRKRLNFGSDDFVVCYFGSPCTLRGTDTLIRSLVQMARRSDRVRLVILSRRGLGEDLFLTHAPEEAYLITLADKLGVSNHLQIIPGILTKEMLRQFLCASDAVALPFKLLFSEAPLSVLEAMGLGKVVITTDVGTLPEIVNEERGIVIKPNDPNGLAMAVSYLMDHPEIIARLGKNAQVFASSLPNWDQVALRVTILCEEIKKEYIKGKIRKKLRKRLVQKQAWQTMKKNIPLTVYRRIRKRIAYRLFGVQKFGAKKEMHTPQLGVDEFGRDVGEGLMFFTQLLRRRGLNVDTVVALGSRAKGRCTPQSDVDVIVIAQNLPEGRKRKRILSDTPIFMDINADGFTPEEFLQHLRDCDMEVFDAIHCGKVICDDGFWLEVKRKFEQMEETYGLRQMDLKRELFLL